MTDTTEKKQRKRNYLNNPDLMEQIRLSKAQGKMTDELAKMCVTLVDKYAMHPQYANIYSYKEDMVSFAYFTLFKSWHYFNPDKSNNPFAYYTQITKHAFYQYVNTEKKQRDIRNAFSVEVGMLTDYEDDGYDENQSVSEVFLSTEARPEEIPDTTSTTGFSEAD